MTEISVLERRTTLFSLERFFENAAGKTWAMPGLRDGTIAITDEKREPRKDKKSNDLKFTISWTDLGRSLLTLVLNKETTSAGSANKPKIQGKSGSEKKKLYFNVTTPRRPEKITIIKASSQLLSETTR